MFKKYILKPIGSPKKRNRRTYDLPRPRSGFPKLLEILVIFQGFLMILEPFWALFERYERTDERTNGRTNGGQSGPASPALAQDDSQPVDGLRPPTPISLALC